MNDLLDENDGLDRDAGVCEPESAADAGTSKTDFEALREEADALKEEAARAKADLYNYRARVERDRKRDRELAAENAVMSLLPVMDNLERALEAESDKDSSMYKGISMVQRQFFSALQGLGLKVIETSGAFDPALHDAIATVDVDDDERDGTVAEVFHKGYMLGDKVLQAAKVKVGRKKTEENDKHE
jgi:molecular chaperone GrpE